MEAQLKSKLMEVEFNYQMQLKGVEQSANRYKERKNREVWLKIKE